MKRKFYRWLFWTTCDFRKWTNAVLTVVVTYARDRAFAKSALVSGAVFKDCRFKDDGGAVIKAKP